MIDWLKARFGRSEGVAELLRELDQVTQERDSLRRQLDTRAESAPEKKALSTPRSTDVQLGAPVKGHAFRSERRRVHTTIGVRTLQWLGKCSCGWQSAFTRYTRIEARADFLTHKQQVSRR